MATHLNFTGAGGVTTPDSAGLSIGGDFRLIARVRAADYSPSSTSTLISKKSSASEFNQEWWWYQPTSTSQLLRLAWTTTGTVHNTATTTNVLGVTDNTWVWLRADLDVDDGVGNHIVTFYLSTEDTTDPSAVTWTQVQQITTAGATSLRDTTSLVEIGSTATESSGRFVGDIQYAAVYADPFGTPSLRGEADFRALSTSATSYTDSLGNVWTFGGGITVVNPDAPQVDWSIVGAPAATTAQVKARLSNAVTGGVLKVSENVDPSVSPVYTSSNVAPDSVGFVEFNATGLAADTDYQYAIEVDGAAHDVDKRGGFHTLPASGTPYSFTFAHTNCMGSPHAVIDHIVAADPLLLLFLGDFDYGDVNSSDPADYRAFYDAQFGDARLQTLARSRWWVSTWDDHDFLGDNVGGEANATTQANRQVRSAEWQRYFPHHPLVDATTNGAIYRSFVVGRVRFIVLDERYYSSTQTDTDDANKTVLGSAQKTWFKNELIAVEPLKIVLHSRTWSGTPAQDPDTWSRFTTERTEIADYVEANSAAVGGLIYVQGDAHMNAADDGQSTDYTTAGTFGGQILVCGGALNRFQSIKGGPYRIARLGVTDQVDDAGNHYGFMTVTDTGSSIDVSWEARESSDGTTATVTVPTDGAPLTATFTTDAAQTVRPVSTTHAGSWTAVGAATLHEAVDEETASFSDYARSEDNASASPAALRLGVLAEPGGVVGDGDVVVRVSYDKEGTATSGLTVELRQGYVSEASPGVLIASTVDADVTDAAESIALALTAAEAAAITYTGGQADDLDVRLVADIGA